MRANVDAIDMSHVNHSAEDTLYSPSEMSSVGVPNFVLQLATSTRVLGKVSGFIN